MKIKLVNYPYQDHQIGEIVDLGEEKNRSMVSLQRAVWVEDEPPPKPKKKNKPTKETPKENKTGAETEEPQEPLDNNQDEKVQEKKKLSFWDKLK